MPNSYLGFSQYQMDCKMVKTEHLHTEILDASESIIIDLQSDIIVTKTLESDLVDTTKIDASSIDCKKIETEFIEPLTISAPLDQDYIKLAFPKSDGTTKHVYINEDGTLS